VLQKLKITICNGETFQVGASIYDKSGTYTDVLTAQSGADSTVTTILTVKSKLSNSQNINICSGETYKIGNSVYDLAGTYTDILQTKEGCDSTVTTILTIKPTVQTFQTFTICSNETVKVGNSVYSTSGIYVDVLQTYDGCDSIVRTYLNVQDLEESTNYVVVCFGEVYTVGTNTYSTSGTYKDVLKSEFGCDSTVNTILTIQKEIDVTTSVNGNTITVSTKGADYQWVNCKDSNSEIFEQDKVSFTPSKNGRYAVEVKVGNCVSTSDCVDISLVNVEDISSETEVLLYPNPNAGSFTIKSSFECKYLITNELGQIIKSFELNSSNNYMMSFEKFRAGIYFITGTYKSETIRKKIVVN